MAVFFSLAALFALSSSAHAQTPPGPPETPAPVSTPPPAPGSSGNPATTPCVSAPDKPECPAPVDTPPPAPPVTPTDYPVEMFQYTDANGARWYAPTAPTPYPPCDAFSGQAGGAGPFGTWCPQRNAFYRNDTGGAQPPSYGNSLFAANAERIVAVRAGSRSSMSGYYGIPLSWLRWLGSDQTASHPLAPYNGIWPGWQATIFWYDPYYTVVCRYTANVWSTNNWNAPVVAYESVGRRCYDYGPSTPQAPAVAAWPTATPTPSPTPTATPSPSPTPTPTPTPTATPTPTPGPVDAQLVYEDGLVKNVGTEPVTLGEIADFGGIMLSGRDPNRCLDVELEPNGDGCEVWFTGDGEPGWIDFTITSSPGWIRVTI